MSRITKNLGFSVPPRMAEEFDIDAKVERLILEAREAERENPLSGDEFAREMDALRQYGAERARALGIASEDDVDRIVYDLRSNG
jgi:hypothetical protein